MFSINLLFPLSILIFSVFIRLNFWPFVQTFGLYQGDWWYFYNNYGQYIESNLFFPIEYPAGYIIIQKIAFFISKILGGFDYSNWIMANALIFIPTGLSIFILVEKLTEQINQTSKRFFLYLLLSPTFFIASTTNYDLLPTALTLLASLLLLKDKINMAFFVLALATVIKIYPAFLLPLFILYILHKKLFFIPVLIFLATISIINLPFMLYNFESWIFPYVWQMQNPQRYDPNTISFFLSYLRIENFRTLFYFVLLSFSWFISWKFYKRNLLTKRNFLFLCFLLLFTAVFGNHVNTPQYTLWFLPFVALFQIPKLQIWWPIDLINASVLFSYFKLHYDFKEVLVFVFYFQVIAFVFIYSLLLYHLKHYYEET